MPLLSTLRSPTPYHLLLYSLALGSTAFHSFVIGPIAFQTLPYDHFSALQARVFPLYFGAQTVASAVLGVTAVAAFPWLAGGANLVLAARASLGVAGAGAALNWGVLGPQTRGIMARRKHQEQVEGKSCKAPDVSEDMRKVNKEFGKVHGISVLANLGTLAGLVAYGVVLSDGVRALARRVPK